MRWRAKSTGRSSAALARCQRDDIELAARRCRQRHRQRLHVFLGTSPTYREHKLHLTPAQVLTTAVEGVTIARELCGDVEFSAQDASRTELEFLAEVIERVIAAGATTINIPDTVGYTVPDEFSELFRYLRKNVRGIDKVILSVHCHDDLGMAVANSLTAVVAGARQIECTINGIGERAGNCSLEEVVMALRTRAAFFNLATNIQPTAPVSGVAPGVQHHRHSHPAQQGGGRRERHTAGRCARRPARPARTHPGAGFRTRRHAI